MYYLMTAVYEAASTNNCVIIGRGSFLMLSDVINHFSLRFVAEPELRIKRIMEKRNCTEKEAKKIIRKDDLGRWAFHKTFFRYDLNNPAKFHMILNTGLINGQEAANFVASGIKKAASPEIEEKGMSRINELLLSQRITNYLAFIAEIPINDLHVFMNGKTITLYGLTDYSATVEKAKTLLRAEFPDYEIISKIDCVQDAKTK